MDNLGTAIANFRSASSSATSGEGLLLAGWRDEDWQELFRFTAVRSVKAGDALIRHGEPDRTLYFVLSGELEIVVRSTDGLTMGRVARVGAGSVLGELAFFDGGPRSAGAWAVNDCEVAAMTPDQYAGSRKATVTERATCFSRWAAFWRYDCGEPTPALSDNAPKSYRRPTKNNCPLLY